jgi:hypothetical protein
MIVMIIFFAWVIFVLVLLFVPKGSNDGGRIEYLSPSREIKYSDPLPGPEIDCVGCGAKSIAKIKNDKYYCSYCGRYSLLATMELNNGYFITSMENITQQLPAKNTFAYCEMRELFEQLDALDKYEAESLKRKFKTNI